MRFIALLTLLLACTVSAQPTTQPVNESEDYALTRVRVLTTTEQSYFYQEVETTYAKIGDVSDRVIDELFDALEKSGNRREGPVTFVYLNATHDMNKPFKLQIGLPVQKGAVESGNFKVRELPSVKAATVLFGGSLQYIGKVYESLFSGISTKGLQPTEEMREAYLLWEGSESPNNVAQIQIVVK